MRVMNGRSLAEALPLKVDTLSRAHLMEALQRSGIQLNASAQTLLDHPIFDRPAPQSVALVERSLGELGLGSGAALPRIFDAAEEQGLRLCPATTGPTFDWHGSLSRTHPTPSCPMVERPPDR